MVSIRSVGFESRDNMAIYGGFLCLYLSLYLRF